MAQMPLVQKAGRAGRLAAEKKRLQRYGNLRTLRGAYVLPDGHN